MANADAMIAMHTTTPTTQLDTTSIILEKDLSLPPVCIDIKLDEVTLEDKSSVTVVYSQTWGQAVSSNARGTFSTT